MTEEFTDRVTEAIDNTTALFISSGKIPNPEEYHELFNAIYKCACIEDVFFSLDDNIVTITRGE